MQGLIFGEKQNLSCELMSTYVFVWRVMIQRLINVDF